MFYGIAVGVQEEYSGLEKVGANREKSRRENVMTLGL